jgi:hypothetical protein
MAMHRIYYKGEGGGFPQVRAVLSIVSPSLPVVVLTPKVFQLCTNQLIVWFVQVCRNPSLWFTTKARGLQGGGPNCRNPNLVKCGGEAQHLEKWGFGVLRDSRMFRA